MKVHVINTSLVNSSLNIKFIGLNFSYDYLIRHNDIDFIGHMNNTKYADALIYEGVCKHFEINFIHEVKLNEVLNIKYSSNKFIGYSGNVLSFKAYCTYF